jgi:hypothetical protein
MSINIGIIDAQATQLATDLAPEYDARLGIRNDPIKQRSLSFVFMVVRALLDLTDDETLECLTEGGNDFGVDAIHVGDIEDGEFQVTLFQGKYTNNATGANAFPQTGVEKAAQAIRYLFDPNATITTNPVLTARVEDIRSQVRDGFIPRVCAVMCSNGSPWDATAQQVIDQAHFPPEQVTWKYVNHDELVQLMQATKQVDDTLHLKGQIIVENFDYCRVLVGKICVSEIETLLNRHGDLLLDRNIRRFLGLQGNRVNTGIAATLNNLAERPNFYFYNNGITLLCKQFAHSGLQGADHHVITKGIQIINGGQTCKTIQSTLSALAGAVQYIEKAFVLVRIYELPDGAEDLVRSITYATNSQSPVDLRDLKSNDSHQKNLETDIAGLTDATGRKWVYLRNRNNAGLNRQHILSSRAAEAVLAVWRSMPHQAKTHNRELFTNLLYDSIFTDQLNGSQAVLATLLFRFAEKKRQRPAAGSPEWITYSSHFVAMLMGRYLLDDLGITLDQLNHTKFADAITEWELKDEQYHARALTELQTAIDTLYGNQPESLQQLAATFRRGDLLERLPQ